MTLSVGLVVLVVMYLGIFGTGIVYMLRLVGKGPQEHEHHELDAEVTANQRPARPLSAVDESLYSSTPKSH
ncbi:hypothetical protein D3C75_1127440 [compost metagenome]